MNFYSQSMRSVRDLIKQLSKMSEEHKDKPITIICPNGLRVYTEVKYKRGQYDIQTDRTKK